MARLSQHGGGAIDQLKDDLRFAREEVNDLSEKASVLEFQNYSLQSEKEVQIKSLFKMDMQLTNLRNRQIV
jgi:hypothetical protein